jgi:hypothetical protein
MGSGDLHRGGSVTLNASGNGTVAMLPDHANQSWQVTYIWVSTNQSPTATTVPQVESFVNGVLDRMNSRGASWAGNQTSFSGLIKVSGLDTLNIVFTAGVPGTVASVVVEGTYRTKGST